MAELVEAVLAELVEPMSRAVARAVRIPESSVALQWRVLEDVPTLSPFENPGAKSPGCRPLGKYPQDS